MHTPSASSNRLPPISLICFASVFAPWRLCDLWLLETEAPPCCDEPMPAATADRDALLALDEQALQRQCSFSAFRTRGPGGQKRNKTSSAARLVHQPTGIVSQCNDFRSQAQNRRRALHRLRFKLAAELRKPIEAQGYEPPAWFEALKAEGRLTTNTKNPVYARLAAHVLDVLEASESRLAKAAALLGVPTTNLAHFLEAEEIIQTAAHQIRQKHGATWRR